MAKYTLHNGSEFEIEDSIASQIQEILADVSKLATKPSTVPHLIRKGQMQLDIKGIYESHLEWKMIEALRQEGFPPSDFNDPRHSLIQFGISTYGIHRTASQTRLADLFKTTAAYFSDRFALTHIDFLNSYITIEDAVYIDAPLPYEARCSRAFTELMKEEAQAN